ncbi:hypothetical protein [Nonomuraea aurantiaca]|uniref:hypothetical protein n=1 Tax=Nonomuraea aurantiaca TaxID=2878562 RepID=UPI001CD92B49|nr:hypothetical protein [Nonomuraea aurantiaca]MCA2228841.1 hypothetical protein [Nonomuraea aurantiaca]
MPSRIRRRMASRYGADPLHLLALLACFALAGYAASRVVAAGIWIGFLVWFVGAAIIHDLLLYPLYALADVAAQRRPWRRRRRPSGTPTWPPPINYLRIPVALSGLLFLIWFPLILRLAEGNYHRSTALDASPYLGRWLLVTGVLFAGSALAYAIRLRRHKAAAEPRRPRLRPPQAPRSSPSG